MAGVKSQGSLLVLAVLAVYSIAHWSLMLSQDVLFRHALFYNAGALSLICMSIAILISIRPKWVEGAFGGLDRMYQVHKWLGIGAMAFFLLHFALQFGEGRGPDDLPQPAVAEGASAEAAAVEEEDEDGLLGLFGLFPMLGFVILILLTLNRKFAYHRWIYTHLLMGVLFMAISFHAILALLESDEISMNTLPGAMILVAIAAGVLAYLYKQTLYRKRSAHAFTLAEVNALGRATEVVLSPVGRRFDFEPGQFAFLRIKDKGFDEAHPFTISSGARDGNIRVTMKVLGDFTRRVREHLKPGVEVMVEGPYGRFNPLNAANRDQIWIAGGIGITPFISALRSLETGHGKRIDVFYGVRDESEALFWKEIQDIAAEVDGVSARLFTSDKGGFLTAEAIAQAVPDDLAKRDFYFCGPKPMRLALIKGLKAKGVPARNFHFEEFEMR